MTGTPNYPNTAPHTHDDHVCRVQNLVAWQCSTCQRIELTTTVIGGWS